MKKRLAAWYSKIIAAPLLLLCSGVFAAENKTLVSPLFDTIAALDADVFDAFNKCSKPAQLQKHIGYFVPDVEFYHDNGGVAWSRDSMIANTKKTPVENFRAKSCQVRCESFPSRTTARSRKGPIGSASSTRKRATASQSLS